MLFWILYGIDVFGNLSLFSEIGFWFSVVFYAASAFGWVIKSYENDGFMDYLGKAKKFIWIPFVCLFFMTFTPSKNTILISAGFKAGKEIVQSEPVNELFQKTYILLDQQLDKAIGNTEKAENK